MHWTHPFGDKVSGKSEYKNQSEAFLADLIHRFFDPVILSLDLKINIQEAKRVPQLYLEVSPSGGKYWRWKYRFASKEKRLGFGVYPNVNGPREAR
jgi:hypothetical protein